MSFIVNTAVAQFVRIALCDVVLGEVTGEDKITALGKQQKCLHAGSGSTRGTISGRT